MLRCPRPLLKKSRPAETVLRWLDLVYTSIMNILPGLTVNYKLAGALCGYNFSGLTMSSAPAVTAQEFNEYQLVALKKLQAGPASFYELLAAGATGIACVVLVKRGLADVSVDTGQKLWALTDAGLALLQALPI